MRRLAQAAATAAARNNRSAPAFNRFTTLRKPNMPARTTMASRTRSAAARRRPSTILGRAVVSGTVGSVTSTVALALLARAEGHAAPQPVNATSHWLHGDQAASARRMDLTHTAVGYATHHAATIFWAVLFERWLAPDRPLPATTLLARALGTSAIAAAVDYGPTPRRFTPGWELVLSKRAMAAAYAAMALGLTAGALLTQRRP